MDANAESDRLQTPQGQELCVQIPLVLVLHSALVKCRCITGRKVSELDVQRNTYTCTQWRILELRLQSRMMRPGVHTVQSEVCPAGKIVWDVIRHVAAEVDIDKRGERRREEQQCIKERRLADFFAIFGRVGEAGDVDEPGEVEVHK